ncbi:MAG: aldo/keto reductase, partial [Chloroflexi bacterium]|nr:aldo/keto reductase [Chloroflexota bacterium]
MRYVEAGGVRVSAIGLGTWQFGSADWGYGADYAGHVAPDLVRRALELGVTLIDTAEAYGGGTSERIVGQALRSTSDPRFLATKMTPILPVPPLVARAANGSRTRLQVEAIDLYQLHFPNPVVPLRFQAAGLRQALDRGLVRNVGVSNYSLARWRAMERALGRPVVSNQVEFSLARSGPARDLVPYAAAHDRLLIAYSPLAQGLLARSGPLVRNPAR